MRTKEQVVGKIAEACAEWYQRNCGFSPKMDLLPKWQRQIAKQTVAAQVVFDCDMEARFEIKLREAFR